ncbi:MAG: imidazole glycerol phosphate synthase subunit HisH [Emcibacter sp.]|nr:imidazole glycerol phosphate synthase subunit HisH [Emcibacter sp.]
MSVTIIDYGSGNLRSAEKAVERCIKDLGLELSVQVTSSPEIVAKADYIILPGVGAFRDCMQGLEALDGMIECLDQVVLKGGRPFLGICVGMQLLASRGYEHGVYEGLDWINGSIKPLNIKDNSDLKVPHMGWNELLITPSHKDHPVLENIKDGDHVYFVHSYKLEAINAKQVMAETEYGSPIPAIVGRDNIIGTQFHPEKSQHVGLQLIGNFLRWKP